jgi:hypothetical protein
MRFLRWGCVGECVYLAVNKQGRVGLVWRRGPNQWSAKPGRDPRGTDLDAPTPVYYRTRKEAAESLVPKLPPRR